jgi:hypothetical protein
VFQGSEESTEIGWRLVIENVMLLTDCFDNRLDLREMTTIHRLEEEKSREQERERE